MSVHAPSDPIERFLALLRHGQPREAARTLADHPEIAASEPAVWCALGDESRLATALAADPGLATRARAPGDWPPILYACASWRHEEGASAADGLVGVVRRLLDAGETANRSVPWDGNPEAKLPALFFASSWGNAPVTRLLLERGAETNDGESIYHAAQYDRRDCLELLLQYGADLSGRHAFWGNTPLYFLLGHHEGGNGTAVADRGIAWLLEHGADPNVTSGEAQETPLHAAVRAGRGRDTIAKLLAHGARPDVARRDGVTPYVLALRHGNTAAAAALLEAGADATRASDVDRFLAACLAGDAGAARRMLAATPELVARAEALAPDRLAHAASHGDVAAVALMLELGFPHDRESADGGTPLHWAAWHGRPAAARMLLERGAAVNVRDRRFGSSPLGWACHGSQNCRTDDDAYRELVELLVGAGADRAIATNFWGAPPEQLASPAVRARLQELGFVPDHGNGKSS